MTSTLTTTQACVNIVNCIIGIGLLAKPYAFALSSWYGIVSMFFAATFCIYTANIVGKIADKYSIHILSDVGETIPQKEITSPKPIYTNDIGIESKNVQTIAMQANDSEKNKNSSIYPTLAQLTLGNIGKRYIEFTLFGALFTTLIAATIMMWILFQDIVSYFGISGDESLLFVIIAVFNLSTTLLLSWKQLTWLSYIAAISIVLVTISMIFLLILSLIDFNGPVDYSLLETYNNGNTLNSNTAGIAENVMNHNILEVMTVSFSLFITGLTAHAILPLIYVNLDKEYRNKSEWNKICLISFGGSAIFYTIVGFVGGWLYGYYTNIVILHNFFLWPGGVIPVIESIIIIINMWSSFGICAAITFEMIEKPFNIFYTYSNNQRRVFRIGCSLIFFALNYAGRNHLAFFSVCNSIFNIAGPALLIPLLMYLVTFYKELSLIYKAFNIILIVFCIFTAFVAIYSDIHLF